MGAIAQKQNDFERAIDIFKRSYEIRMNYYGEDNLYTSISLRNYAKALMEQGNCENLQQAGALLCKVEKKT